MLLKNMLLAIFLMGSSIPITAQQSKIKVAVTIDALKPFVTAILGSVGEVYSIVPEDVEPHGFTITPNVIRDSLNSDLIVTTGHMEWENDLVEQVASGRGVTPDLISLNLLSLVGIRLLEFDGERNPHGYWLLPENAVVIARGLRDKLSALKPEYSSELSHNCETFEERVSNLKAFLKGLPEKYGLSETKVVIGFYAEQYVAEAMGLKADVVLIGEGEAISPGSLSKIYNGLKSGEYACVIVSETALRMSGVQSALQEISRETGCSIAYVSVISTSGLKYYDAIMYYNAGQVYSALVTGRKQSSGGFNTYLLVTAFALAIAVVEAFLIVRGKVRA